MVHSVYHHNCLMAQHMNGTSRLLEPKIPPLKLVGDGIMEDIARGVMVSLIVNQSWHLLLVVVALVCKMVLELSWMELMMV
jgi:hypothetical protein